MEDIKTIQDIQGDQQVIAVEKQSLTLVDKAKALVVNNELTSKAANNIGIALKEMIKKLDDRRRFFNKPLKEHAKAIDNDFNARMSPLKQAYEIVRKKLADYIIGKNRILQEQKVKQREENELKMKKASVFLGEKARIPEIKPEKSIVTSSFGKSYTVKRWTWKLLDFSKVPEEFKLLDEKKLNGMIRVNTKTIKGVSQCDLKGKIPGIEIYQTEDINMRR